MPTRDSKPPGTASRRGQGAEPPLYLVLDDLARYLVARLEAGEAARFDAIFDVVER